MTEKVGEWRELRELVCEWRKEASEYKNLPNDTLNIADLLNGCADELEAALAKQTPAPREVGQAQAWGERIGRIEAFKEAARHKYSHGRIGSACACGVRFEGNADREWPAHIESLAGEQTPAPRDTGELHDECVDGNPCLQRGCPRCEGVRRFRKRAGGAAPGAGE